jgi:hypothetical protein
MPWYKVVVEYTTTEEILIEAEDWAEANMRADQVANLSNYESYTIMDIYGVQDE